MRTRNTTISASALLLLATCGGVAEASWHGQAHERIAALHKKHHDHRELHRLRSETLDVPADALVNETSVGKRSSGTCSFPSNLGLVAVAPDQQNAGWAMSPDQPCKCGSWCPYACPPGQVSMQWNPDVLSYVFPGSMEGGLYCDDDGNINKPFKNRPHCQDGAGTFVAKNTAGGTCSICQTVLPGNEAMLIPTEVGAGSTATLAVPTTNYWAGTAAHYYINPPGIEAARACTWGTKDHPWGNWSPYVAGANADDSGNTYTKIAWNPIYLEPATPFKDKKPDFGIRLTCDGHCNGLPCAIDPAKNDVNEMEGSSTIGVGGAAFCVVTAPKGVKVTLEVFDSGSSSSSSSSSSNTNQKQAAPSHSSTSATPTPSSSSSTSSSASSPTTSPSTISSSSSSFSSVSSSSSSEASSSSSSDSDFFSSTSSSASAGLTALPQLLFENSTSVSSAKLSSGAKAAATAAATGASSAQAAQSSTSTNGGKALAASTFMVGFGLLAAGMLL